MQARRGEAGRRVRAGIGLAVVAMMALMAGSAGAQSPQPESQKISEGRLPSDKWGPGGEVRSSFYGQPGSDEYVETAIYFDAAGEIRESWSRDYRTGETRQTVFLPSGEGVDYSVRTFVERGDGLPRSVVQEVTFYDVENQPSGAELADSEEPLPVVARFREVDLGRRAGPGEPRYIFLRWDPTEEEFQAIDFTNEKIYDRSSPESLRDDYRERGYLVEEREAEDSIYPLPGGLDLEIDTVEVFRAGEWSFGLAATSVIGQGGAEPPRTETSKRTERVSVDSGGGTETRTVSFFDGIGIATRTETVSTGMTREETRTVTEERKVAGRAGSFDHYAVGFQADVTYFATRHLGAQVDAAVLGADTGQVFTWIGVTGVARYPMKLGGMDVAPYVKGGVYVDIGEVSRAGVKALGGLEWRATRNVGLFTEAGFRLHDSNEYSAILSTGVRFVY